MRTHASLVLAGIPFHLRWSGSGPLMSVKDFSGTVDSGSAGVEVCIKSRIPGIPLGFKQTFSAGDAWALFRRGKERIICYPACPGNAGLIWTARFSLPVHEVSILRKKVNLRPFAYPLDQLVLMYVLAGAGGLIIHAAGVKHGGRVLLFAGPSGAGKTTICRLLNKAGIGDVLSDDRMIVKRLGRMMYAYGTPWPGTLGVAVNESGPLAGIVFLKKAIRNRLVRLKERDALARLLGVGSVPWFDEEAAGQALDFCSSLAGNVPFYELSFARESSVAQTLRKVWKSEHSIEHSAESMEQRES